MQNFIDDKEKMNDFKNLSKNEFLKSIWHIIKNVVYYI